MRQFGHHDPLACSELEANCPDGRNGEVNARLEAQVSGLHEPSAAALRTSRAAPPRL